MEKKAYILKADGTREDLDHRPNLEEAQKIVGGWVEYAHCHNPSRLLVVDEEGLLKRKAFNKEATGMYGRTIVGDAIVLEGWKTLAS